ncbi:G-protein coupled receptor Mth2-like [Galleria mellonella]|uniref:G-protein coupled receptor Mth2-like n=1 Tax=Galleria mellonella TaxID=7137 RepID=A0ABM3MPP1_GALME|nr:G-protein coupled receptor Mth2-like [Galleria mellonella]
MTLFNIYILILFLHSIKCQNISICDDKTLIDINGNIINKMFCQEKPCIISRYQEPCVLVKRNSSNKKTCELMDNICNRKENSRLSRFQNVYKKVNGNIVKSNRTFQESFHIVTFKNKYMYQKICSGDWATCDYVHNIVYFMEDGSILLESPNSGVRYQTIDENKYIILFYAEESEYGLVPNVAIKVLERTEQPDLKGILVAIGMLVSSFFMILVIIVYAVLKELRNLFGLVLMAYLGTFSLAFLTKAIQTLGLLQRTINVTTCLYLEPFVYFGILSSFMWMNVMSFDIWRKFRETHCQRSNRRVLRKFIYYGLYAWLTPAVLVVAEVLIDHMDLSHLPNFKKPSFDTCSFYPISKLIYLLSPIMVILIINMVLFCLTSFNMWTIKKELRRFDRNETTKNKKNRNRFTLFLRLSLVMGTNWIFEILGAIVDLPDWFENLVDAYNVLVGVFIFFVFVFKTNIFRKIFKSGRYMDR